jgi:UDP-glucose 4-epimerase
MKVVVTGAAGFIGDHLVRALGSSLCVVAVDNLHRCLQRGGCLHGSHVTFIRGDIRDYEFLVQAFKGASVVFHLAAKANVMQAAADSDYTHSTNTTGTLRVLEAAAIAGVGRVVFTSSREVYGDPLRVPVSEDAPLSPKNVYGASKAAAEMYCRAYIAAGLEVAVLRLANVYGPGDHDRVVPLFIENAIAGRPLLLYGGDQVLDLVPMQIVTDALIRSGFGPYHPGPINIGTGSGITIRDLARRIIAETGSGSLIRVEPARGPEVRRFVADISRSKAWLKLTPPADPLQGLAEVIQASSDTLSRMRAVV